MAEALTPLVMKSSFLSLLRKWPISAVQRLKRRKAHGLLAEHLDLKAGEAVEICLRNILNGIVELEVIPWVLKRGIIHGSCVQSWRERSSVC